MPARPEPQEPWVSLLRALDERLDVPVEIHCLGGFVVTMLYGIARGTSDIDILVVGGGTDFELLQRLAGQGSDLHRRFRVYLQPVPIVTYSENYSDRLVTIWPELHLKRIRLLGLEEHDLALTKLERNADVDRDDVRAMARAGLIDASTLRKRYFVEFRPNLASGVERHDLTLKLWLGMIQEVCASRDRESSQP